MCSLPLEAAGSSDRRAPESPLTVAASTVAYHLPPGRSEMEGATFTPLGGQVRRGYVASRSNRYSNLAAALKQEAARWRTTRFRNQRRRLRDRPI